MIEEKKGANGEGKNLFAPSGLTGNWTSGFDSKRDWLHARGEMGSLLLVKEKKIGGGKEATIGRRTIPEEGRSKLKKRRGEEAARIFQGKKGGGGSCRRLEKETPGRKVYTEKSQVSA